MYAIPEQATFSRVGGAISTAPACRQRRLQNVEMSILGFLLDQRKPPSGSQEGGPDPLTIDRKTIKVEADSGRSNQEEVSIRRGPP